MPRVVDHMTSAVSHVSPDQPFDDVICKMRQAKAHHLVVLERERLVGIISDRDVNRALPSALSPNGNMEFVAMRASLTAGDIMTRHVTVASPETRVEEAVLAFLSGNVHALPVVDPAGKLVGIITATDCLRALLALNRTT